MSQKTFTSAASFRQSLENRLHAFANESGVDLQRLRRKVAFERFLARIFHEMPSLWVLKGGYGLELRFETSRATKDLDLDAVLPSGTKNSEDALYAQLSKCATVTLDDFFRFEVRPAAKQILDSPYGGCRYPVRSSIAGRLFTPFSVDVGIAYSAVDAIDEVYGDDWLGFCGVPPAKVRVVSLEQQFAEKLHALTVQHSGEGNSRVKDLVDLLLLIRDGLDREKVGKIAVEVFQKRDGSAVPSKLPELPPFWVPIFHQVSRTCGIQQDLEDSVAEVNAFLSHND